MASYGHAVPPAAAPRPAAYGAAYGAPPPPAAMPVAAGAPAGTFTAGTKIQVGSHRVVIQKYLSEGGFAHVYLVRLAAPVNGTDQAVLKRVAVADKESLRGMRTEVETMKRLKGHSAIVTYIDSHASELRGGGYEVFLLMEYCNGGGLIDFMNTRLQHRLTEPEILKIFGDVAEGVACMHYLRPPLLHRDLKVENVLITISGSSRKFKLCDFGSAAPPRPAPVSVVDCRLMDEDVQKHTTMQYRSPEMVDVYRKQPIDEKSDIWALGVLLYKLCYYTTPFEDQGQLAILNASYRFPSYPVFSDRLKGLIAWMLREIQQQRPNIYQVLHEACSMQGREPPIKDIYSGGKTAHPDSHRHDQSRQDQNVTSPPMIGAVFSPQLAQQQQAIPEVERMRRGRVPAAQPAAPAKGPSPSPPKVTNGDPFAALDSKPLPGGDELSSRFPTLDQFSLLHDRGKVEFETTVSLVQQQASQQQQQPQPPQKKDLAQRVTERLADEAFQVKPPPSPAPAQPNYNTRQSTDISRQNVYPSKTPEPSMPAKSMSAPLPKQPEMSRASAIISSTPELQAIATMPSQPIYQTNPKPIMVSTGTMTSPPPPEWQPPSQYQVYRFPAAERNRASSVPRPLETPPATGSLGVNEGASSSARTPPFQGLSQPTHVRHPSSSRPSLEGGRPSPDLLLDNSSKPPSKSQLSLRPTPVSTNLESNMDYLREREAGSSKQPQISPSPVPTPSPSPRYPAEKELPPPPVEDGDETLTIGSSVDFLRSMEDQSHHTSVDSRKKEKHHQPKHSKRSSLSSLGAGTKNILAGKFGDAFKRFEGNSSQNPPHSPIAEASSPRRTPSPLKELERGAQRERERELASEVSDDIDDGGRARRPGGDDESMTTAMTPEMRREQEARMLAREEERVAAAQAEYRQRVSQQQPGSLPLGKPPKSIGGVSRAISIQNKVQSLLDETNKSSTGSGVARTAQGYGHYTDPAHDASGTSSRGGPAAEKDRESRPAVPRKPIGTMNPSGSTPSMVGRVATAPMGRPTAPPKPTHLGRVGTGSAGVPGSGITVNKVRGGVSSSAEAFVVAETPGASATLVGMTAAEQDDFHKRFPSLGALEMVERDVERDGGDKGAVGRG